LELLLFLVFWHCCSVYLLLPVVPGVLALLYTWSCCFPGCFGIQYCAVYLLLLSFLVCWHCCIPGAFVVPGCSGIAVLFTCYYLLFLVFWHCSIPGAAAFLVVLVYSTVLFTCYCCRSWCAGIAVYLELLLFLVVLALLCCLPVTTVVPGVLALLCTWSCCCS
jgi:hypothetical protein